MGKLLWFLLLVMPIVILTFTKGPSLLSYADEDPLEEDDVEAEVEDEGDVDSELEVKGSVQDQEPDADGTKSTASPDADTTLLFVQPATSTGNLALPAGLPVEFLVGFRNKGDQDFIVESIETSFKYPMDFTYTIHNFSAVPYNKVVPATYEATLAYSFLPPEAFAGRPFGLFIDLAYRDESGAAFHEALYNETVQVIDRDEGFNGETFFLYVVLIAGVVLLLVIGQQTLLSFGKKRIMRKSTAPIETGTNHPNNVDYEWLPAQTLATINRERAQKNLLKSKQSPKQRKPKKKSGSE